VVWRDTMYVFGGYALNKSASDEGDNAYIYSTETHVLHIRDLRWRLLSTTGERTLLAAPTMDAGFEALGGSAGVLCYADLGVIAVRGVYMGATRTDQAVVGMYVGSRQGGPSAATRVAHGGAVHGPPQGVYDRPRRPFRRWHHNKRRLVLEPENKRVEKSGLPRSVSPLSLVSDSSLGPTDAHLTLVLSHTPSPTRAT
jgi:hypothetical protein